MLEQVVTMLRETSFLSLLGLKELRGHQFISYEQSLSHRKKETKNAKKEKEMLRLFS